MTKQELLVLLWVLIVPEIVSVCQSFSKIHQKKSLVAFKNEIETFFKWGLYIYLVFFLEIFLSKNDDIFRTSDGIAAALSAEVIIINSINIMFCFDQKKSGLKKFWVLLFAFFNSLTSISFIINGFLSYYTLLMAVAIYPIFIALNLLWYDLENRLNREKRRISKKAKK